MLDGMDTEAFARTIRGHVLRMVHRANASHVGSCLSMADLLAVLYGGALRVDPSSPEAADRDRFILSKGHGAAAVYAALAARGFFPEGWLETYGDDGARLSGHLTRHGIPGVEFSTGSLGHGLPVASGIALAGKRQRKGHRVFCLLSDGECNEGSVWEAAMFAPHHRLDNLVAIIDYNRIQSFGRVEDVLDPEPFADKWRAFGWAVTSVNGHNHQLIQRCLADVPLELGRPTAIIAHTIKGKGVPFMEDRLEWHYRSPNARQLEEALEAVEAGQ